MVMTVAPFRRIVPFGVARGLSIATSTRSTFLSRSSGSFFFSASFLSCAFCSSVLSSGLGASPGVPPRPAGSAGPKSIESNERRKYVEPIAQVIVRSSSAHPN
jgi:hypothetical protein